MRGAGGMQESLFMVAKLDDFVPVEHPLRKVHKGWSIRCRAR